MHIIVGLDAGGAELVLQRLLEKNRGHTATCEQTVVSLTNIGAVGQALQELGFAVTALNLRSVLDIPRAFIRLVQQIRRFDPDIVQTWMYHADFFGGLAARLAGKQNVIWGIRCTTVQNSMLRTAVLRKASAWLSHLIPKAIVCVADAALRAHAAIGYDQSKMIVIPNGFDIAKFDSSVDERHVLRTSLGFACDDVVIGTVGRDHVDKDYANFVAAAGLVARHFPAARFLMIGRGLTYENKRLLRSIEEVGLLDSFVLAGERRNVPSYLSAIDIFVLSSRNEGFPNVVGEAMSSCCPCVVTDVGDASLLVGAEGVVVPKENAPALADGIMQIAAKPIKKRVAIGQTLRKRIESEYTLDRTVQSFRALYEEVLQRSVGK